MTVLLTDALRAEYQSLFDSCQNNSDKQSEVATLADRIIQHRSRYEAVGTPLSIPWFFIGVIHNMESSQRFDRHLHNGDPLTARTVHVPPGRPVAGDPPFTWEDSATDALQLEKLDKVTDWKLPALLYQIEKYNGFGYRTRHPEVLSPYLWIAGSGVQRNHFLRWAVRVKHAADDDRAGLQTARFASVVSPDDLKLLYIVTIDLSERRVVVVLRRASVDRPVARRGLGGCETGVRCGQRKSNVRDESLQRRSAHTFLVSS